MDNERKIAVFGSSQPNPGTDRYDEALPSSLIFQNTPNLFNLTTPLRFELNEAADVRLDVYDMLGREKASLVNEPLTAGNHAFQFDGSELSSGVYVYQLDVGRKSETGRITLMN